MAGLVSPSAGRHGRHVFDHAHHLATQVVYAAWLVEVGRVRIGDHVLVVPEVGQADARLWRGRVIAADWHPKVACTPQDVTGGRLADEPYGLWVRPKQRARGACEEHVLACRVLLDAAHHDEPERERAMRVHVARGDLRLFEQVAADGDPGRARDLLRSRAHLHGPFRSLFQELAAEPDSTLARSIRRAAQT